MRFLQAQTSTTRLLLTLLLLASPTLAACTEQGTAPAPTHPSMFEAVVSPPADNEIAEPNIALQTGKFTGEIVLDSETIVATESGFELPVYLREVRPEHAVDTVTLKTFLPDGVRLQKVVTPTGFTTQLDGIEGSTPVVYYHSFSITPESYSPVVATDEPTFTLIFSGEKAGKLAAQGSFFQADGSLIRTNRAVLQL